jgi:hypothetical protein
MNLQDKIIETARSYIGQEETVNNSGFKNSWFQNLMVRIGWLKGQSWCAYFAKLAWHEAFTYFDPDGARLILKYANGSAYQTYQNFARSREFHVQVNPVPGALVIFRLGNSWQGHEGIVTTISARGFYFVSGNTSKAGSREGTTVLEKFSALNEAYEPDGLNLTGFVNPIRIA